MNTSRPLLAEVFTAAIPALSPRAPKRNVVVVLVYLLVLWVSLAWVVRLAG